MERRQSYHHGNLREALMDATVGLVGREGLHGFSLNAVARAAGVSTAAPYRHFASREALLDAVVERGWDEFVAALHGASTGHPDDPLDRLYALGACYVAFAIDRSPVFRLLFDQRDHPTDRVRGRAAFDVLLDCVNEAHRRGLLRSGSEPLDVAHAAWALVHGLALLQLGGGFVVTRPGVPAHEVTAAVLRQFVDGLVVAQRWERLTTGADEARKRSSGA